MRAYQATLRLALQEAMQYRIESGIWFLWDVLPPIAMAFLWLTAFRDQQVVAGYDQSEMLLYTVGVMVLRTMITAHTEWSLDYEIRQGLLSTYLVKPFNVWGYWFAGESAWKVMRALWLTPVLVGCLIWLWPFISPARLPLDRLPLLLVSVVLGYVVCFFMKLCLGFVGFWTNDITGTTTLYEVTANIVGGVIVPLALLPGWLRTVASFLPIQAVYNIPLSILLAKDADVDPLVGIAIQLGWIVGLWLLALVMWRAGLRRYESVGG
jgi:ABC-2 type transport system permease protein